MEFESSLPDVRWTWECKCCGQKSGKFKKFGRMVDASINHEKWYCDYLKMKLGPKVLDYFPHKYK